MMTDAQKQQIEAAHFTREWLVFVGPIRDKTQALLVLLGEPVILARHWTEISRRVTKNPIINEWWDGNICDWTANIEGVQYNAELMPPDASILIKEKITVPGGATGWQLAALGYVRKWNVTGDKWNATVVSLSSYVNEFEVDARQYGKRDVARGASVSASGTIANTALVPEEFGGGIGEADPSHLTDGNQTSVWISDVAPE